MVMLLLHACVSLHLSVYLPGCLCEVFMWLGFEIKIEHDCTSEKMLSVLRDLGRRDHSQMDCVVCCVLSHGNDGGVYGVDGQTVKLMELMESLNGLKCPSLAEKPKLFFIQACQGTSEQRAVYIEADGPARSLVCSDAIEAKDSIPTDADFLQAMATVPSCVSFRERKNGTWFIQSLCQNLVQMVPRLVKLNIRYCWLVSKERFSSFTGLLHNFSVLTTY